ncbi:MAG: hypothetical protein ABI968_08790 [Acidobacteriota bacterium]
MRNEGECLRLLRRTDLSEDVFREVLADGGARKFHAVRRALAAHPRTPRGEAMALVSTLYWRDLANLSADARVHPVIRRAADQNLLRRLSEMAIAEKVDLARTVGRGTLLRLRLDLDPRVVASVLDNRFTTEPDVVQAAVQPMASAQALVHIAEHPRWGSRPAVRSALLRHPSLPEPLALSLLTRATRDDLLGLRDSLRASALLRACAERVLAERLFED